MTSHDLALLRRKESVGTAAAICWLLFLVQAAIHTTSFLTGASLVTGWALTVAWVALDASSRDARAGLWAFLTVIALPLGVLMYMVMREPHPAVCLGCGSMLPLAHRPCAMCGRQAVAGRALSALMRARTSVVESLAMGSSERSRETAKHMTIALAGTVLVSWLLTGVLYYDPMRGLVKAVNVFSIAAYWVLAAWWVYMDATWRKMDAAPWGILTLLTNVVGMVTYLVIRYPEPRSCANCGAGLSTGLKRCPYCGAEAEPTCPRCQSQVKADWLYCPACSAQLPSVQGPSQVTVQAPPSLAVSGTVVDALSGSPIAYAEVRVDSRTSQHSTATDPQGRFSLASLDPRPYVLVATAPGYAGDARPLTPSPTEASRVHFSLYPVTNDAG